MILISFALFTGICAVLGLKIEISTENILKQSIKYESIRAGLENILMEGYFEELAQILQYKTIDMKQVYLDVIDPQNVEHVFYLKTIYDIYNSGHMTRSSASLLLSNEVISKILNFDKQSPSELVSLPVNPLTDAKFVISNLNEESLLATMQRALNEKDVEVLWTNWPLQLPANYRKIWNQPETWKLLLIETFEKSTLHVKRQFFNCIKEAAQQLTLPSADAADKLLMINISLFSFYIEVIRLRREYRESGQVQGQFSDFLDELEYTALQCFNSIKYNVNNRQDSLFSGLDMVAVLLASKDEELLKLNPFYYENRIELFSNILQRLKTIPGIFADWFGNFYYCFADVIGKMSVNLLSDSWELFLSLKPSIEAVSNALAWFHGKIKEDFRFNLAQLIPQTLLNLIYERGPVGLIPNPINLIPFNTRKINYLKHSRAMSNYNFVYNLTEFWQPEIKPLIKLLKLFYYIEDGKVNLFESINIVFVLQSGCNPVGLSKFLEMLLKMFLSVKEWYFIVKQPSEKSPFQDELEQIVIIPSPFFPPKFMTILMEIIIRCRHLSCQLPFKFHDSILISALNHECPFNTLKSIVKSEMNFLVQPNNRFPRLTMHYLNHFDRLIKDSSVHQNPQYQQDQAAYVRNYYNLHQKIQFLHSKANEMPQYSDLNAMQLEAIELQLYDLITLQFEYLGRNLRELMGSGVIAMSKYEYNEFLFNN